MTLILILLIHLITGCKGLYRLEKISQAVPIQSKEVPIFNTNPSSYFIINIYFQLFSLLNMWDLIIIKRKQMLNTQQYRYLEIISHHISFWESNLEIGSLQSSSWLRRAGGWYWKQRRLCQYWRCVQLSSLQQLRKQRCFCVNSNGGRGKK